MTESNTENATEVQRDSCCGCLKVTCNGFCEFDAVVVRKELPVPEDAKSNVVYWMNNVAYILSEDKTKLVPLTGKEYVLPAATTSTLGGVIVGNGLNVTEDGTTSLQTSSASKLGGVKVGSGLTSKADGTISTTFTQTDAEVLQVGSAFGVPNASGLIEHISVVMSSQSDILPSIDYIGVFKVTPSTIDDSALTELQTMISGIETKPSEDGKNNIYNFILESPFDASTGEYVIQFYIKKQGQRIYHNLEVITPKAAVDETPIFDLLTIKYDLDTKYAYIDFTLPGNDYSVVTEYRRNDGSSTDAWTPIDNATSIDTSTNPNIIRSTVDLNILYRNAQIKAEYLVRFTVSTNFGATVHLRQPILTYNTRANTLSSATYTLASGFSSDPSNPLEVIYDDQSYSNYILVTFGGAIKGPFGANGTTTPLKLSTSKIIPSTVRMGSGSTDFKDNNAVQSVRLAMLTDGNLQIKLAGNASTYIDVSGLSYRIPK